MAEAADETTPLVRRHNNVALKVRVVTAIISLAEGYDIGVVNGAVVLFREELKLSALQVGIVLSFFPLMVSVCAPMAGSFSDWAGRKRAMQVSSVLLITGGLLMAFANGFFMLVAGRMTAGSGVGVGITAVTSYMAEVAPQNERGFYASLEELFVNIGNVVGYIANLIFLSVPNGWRYMLGLGILPAVLVLISLLLPYSLTGIPESPRWLQKVGQHDEAKVALLDLLDGDEEEAERAFQAWQTEARVEGGMASWGESLTAFCTDHRRVALAGIGVGVMNMWTGIMLMMVTTSSLLVGAGMEKRTAMLVTVFLGVTKATVMLVVALCFLDSWGRRPLLLLSLSICSLASALGAATGFLGWGDIWVIVGLCVFVTGYSVGVGPVPWVYMPEVLRNRYRAKGCALGLSGARLCAVTHLFLFPIFYPIIGLTGLFVFLLTANAMALVYVLAFCPETRGRSLEEIHQIFDSPRVPEKLA
jgi:sugar porter (SP) family MFS transporter